MKKIIFLLLIPVMVSAQKNYSDQLDKYALAHMNVKGFSGAVLVMQHDKVLLKKAYGLADREWNVPNTTETIFLIASLTKQFTAACIMQLVEQGKLNLTDKLSKFIPDFPKGDSVTIHMLLNHTSGIANYANQPEYRNVRRLGWNKDSIVSFLKNKPYEFSPGIKWSYNNSGYFLLGYIIEKISGSSYEDYLRQHIFNSLGMNNTGVNKTDSVMAMRARGYGKDNNRIVNAETIISNWNLSVGSLYSTLNDLYKWDRALYGTSVLSDASKQKMFTNWRDNYGYGLIIDTINNHFRIWHPGTIPGFFSNMSHYVNNDVCIIVLSNTTITLSNTLFITDVIAEGLAGIVFGWPVEIPYIHKEVKIDPALWDKYVGKYFALLTLEVIKKDGKLYRHRDGTPDIELKPESETKFFYADESDRQLQFEVDKTGKVTKIWFINNGQRGEMKKVQ